MTLADHRFYVTGGSLPPDSPSYVERKVDRELYDALQLREFCYVLTARQMGKSSLMVRTAARLREEGVRVAVLDLTAIGQNVAPEQWYYSLLDRLGEQHGLEEELDPFWLKHQRLGPLRRFMATIEQVVLPGLIPLVIFIDEIDAVRSLPFPTDEFFAAIRECHNRRSETAALRQLTFCLLGTAAPTDLIRDTRMTPFNIGRRIELTDFSEAEAAPLAAGLEVGELGAPGQPAGVARSLLKRIFDWTGGHPYLTQRLCQSVAAATGDGQRATNREREAPVVDGLCEDLFLARSAQEKDDNLIFVRERLLRSEPDLAALLELYGRVRRGKPVPYDETDPLCSNLRLSGLVRVSERPDRGPQLVVRNRIYARVFDARWLAKRMPDAELRRQRAAYRRGLARATMLSGVVVGLLGGLAWTALRLADDRRQALIGAGDLLYVSQMNLAHQASTSGKMVRAQRLLEQHRPKKGQPDRRDFVWRFLWGLCRSQDRYTFPQRDGYVRSVAFSRDGRVLATDGDDGALQLWDAAGKTLLTTVRAHQGSGSVVFSPDGRLLATVGWEDASVKVWDATSRPLALRRQFEGLRGPGQRAFFTPDGETLIAGSKDNTVRLWDLGTGPAAFGVGRSASGVRRPIPQHSTLNTQHPERSIPVRAARPLALSPDGKTLAVSELGRNAGRVTLWDVSSRKVTRHPVLLAPIVGSGGAAFSPDGRLLAIGGPGRIVLWDTFAGRVLRSLTGHEGVVVCVAFSPDGKLLASGAFDGTIRLWDPRSGMALATLQGHTSTVLSVAWSPLGDTLASASADGTTRLWDPDARRRPGAGRDRTGAEILAAGADGVGAVAFFPDGNLLAEVRSRFVSIWNVPTKARVSASPLREQGSGAGRRGLPRGCEFSPDGKLLAIASGDGSVKLWDATARRVMGALHGIPSVVTSLGFAAGGLLVTANGGGPTGAAASVKVWEVASCQLLATLPAESDVPLAPVAVSPDGETIAIFSPEHRVTLWDIGSRGVPSGRGRGEPRKVATLEGVVRGDSLAFSPDGKIVAGGSREGAVYLWDRASGRQIRRLVGHVGAVQAVAFSPDGKTLASGGMDGMVRLWNPTVDQEEATLTGHRDWVWTMAFSPDGNILATGSPDGTVRLWRAAPFAETDAPQAVGSRK